MVCWFQNSFVLIVPSKRIGKSRNLSKIVSVLLSAQVERVGVSHMRDFYMKLQSITLGNSWTYTAPSSGRFCQDFGLSFITCRNSLILNIPTSVCILFFIFSILTKLFSSGFHDQFLYVKYACSFQTKFTCGDKHQGILGLKQELKA